MRRGQRVGAYAVCVEDGRILLARWVDRSGAREWTLPGGGVEHGEDPYDAVLREVAEETGHTAEVTALLGVGSRTRRTPRRLRRPFELHGVSLYYEARITGGTLRPEVGGSTDLAAWRPLTEVPALTRVPMVDTALRLWRDRPAHGHPAG
ncbi:NUDIX hydrolase [Streptomyces lichenis]|uniref:NUDIX hydrolase n=1 Tax=Streptomyces lichenis TaxID=2306967 RepID=A0ABT0I668_9ACTN|nr:NUDIX hydrolase [Streptomyces lichenis]MCK8676811.1 NUDIX hydrolase [Streptomyces lichenis]